MRPCTPPSCATVAILSMALLAAACQKEPAVVPGPAALAGTEKTAVQVFPVRPFNQLFTRYSAWTGGDQAYSIRLPDGRDLWLFGDSFIDTVYADRSRPGSPLVRNSYLTQQGQELVTLNSTVGGVVQPMITPQQAGEWYWPGDGFVSGDQLYIFQQRIEVQGSGSFGFAQTGVDLSRYSLPDLTLQQVVPWTFANEIAWGVAVMEDVDHVYIYGTESGAWNKYVHVARTPTAAPFSTVEYWDGTNWTTDPATTARVRSGVSQCYSVFKHAGQYYLLSQANLLGPDIWIWRGPTPVGPFTHQKLVATTPVPPGCWTYNALAHPQWTTPQGDLLIGYSVNAMNFWDVFENADKYRPLFFRARGWE